MTEEQIQQNAHDYTYTNDHNWTWDDSGESRVDVSAEISDAFIAGAHSRDDEIEELEQALAFTDDVVDAQKKQLDKLRNPWRDAKNDPPKDMKPVVGYDDGIIGVYEYSPEEKIWSIGMLISDAPEYWMPMPETQKGGEI